MNECHLIIDNNLNSKCLRVFLGLLCERYKGISPSNKELLVLLFGYLAKAFKAQLLDPLDKPPTLLKTIVRVVEAVHFYLRVNERAATLPRKTQSSSTTGARSA